MNPDPDYSAAYVVLAHRRATARGPRADLHDRARQRDLRARPMRALAPLVVGRTLESFPRDMGALLAQRSPATASCAGSGPEKGVIHLATAAVVNAVWDLWAKAEGKPLWKLLADMTPEELVALRRLPLHHRRARRPTRRSRSCERARGHASRARGARCARDGYPAYTTSAGWLGYADDEVARLCREAVADGLDAPQDEGRRRPRGRRPPRARSSARRSARTASLMMDANQVWDVDEAIAQHAAPRARSTRGGSRSRPAPTTSSATPRIARALAPDRRRDRRALPEPRRSSSSSCRPRRSASARSTPAGSAASTRCWPCSCWPRSSASRSARTPAASGCASTSSTCPSSTTSRVSGSLEDRVVEYVDHLHEHFVDPVVMRERPLHAADAPGYSIEMHADFPPRARVSAR